MSPTEHKVGAGDDERRIWSLRLRVHPDDEPAFEARSEHGFRPSPDFEVKIESGHTFNMVPGDDAEVEVAYDPGDREWVIVRPRDGAPKGLRLAGVEGVPLRSMVDDDTPPRPSS